jgi:hypothetical protein
MVEEKRDFESYLMSSLNDSLIKKSNNHLFLHIFTNRFLSLDEIKSLKFESWWIENKEKNLITVIFHLDGNPHELIIKDTKYYVKELYSCDKHKNSIITVRFESSLTKYISAGIYLLVQKLIYSVNLRFSSCVISKLLNGINFMEAS